VVNLKQITAALNAVQSVGQARAAAGQCLIDLNAGYALLPRIVNGSVRANAQADLDRDRAAVERTYPKDGADSDRVDGTAWAIEREIIRHAYTNGIAGAEGASGMQGNPSFGAELVDAVQKAPGVIGSAVGTVIAGTASVAGDVVGNVLRPIFPLLVVIAIAAVAMFFVRQRIG
jgi:hypothetical protein